MQTLRDTKNETKQFLLSQYFADGLKITLGVLLPSLVLYQFGWVESGIAVSLGALCISIVDNPGPPIHKRNAMLVTIPLVFAMALITGFSHAFHWLLAVEIGLFCFLFSMFGVYGARAGAVGTAALIIVILGLGKPLEPQDVFWEAVFLLSGGVWYMLLSLSVNTIWPYRVAQQVLGESIRELAEYLNIKADFYDTDKSIEDIQKRLTQQQMDVHLDQDNVREILFKTRKLLRDSSPESRRLILIFVDTVDLFEQAMATHYDYSYIQHQFKETGILKEFGSSIRFMADELNHIGRQLHNRETIRPLRDLEPKLNGLKKQLDEVERNGLNTMVLKKVLVNLRSMGLRIQQIYKYAEPDVELKPNEGADFSKFVSKQRFDFKIFRENLNLQSSIFRHSLRVSVVCLLVFIVAGRFYTGHYGYWILLTILVILKPGFSLTKQRNYERVIGTIIGGLIGAGLLYFVHNKTLLFLFLLLFMVLSYSFLRLRYVVGVLFMTPYILIMFSFTVPHEAVESIVKERILDTLIGAAIAGVASYYFLPSWESQQIKKLLADTILSNATYLAKAIELNENDKSALSEYRLARKKMYVAQANLSSAFQRMLDEPKDHRKNATNIHRLVILNHTLSSYIATLKEQLGNVNAFDEEDNKKIRKSISLLKDTYREVEGNAAEWPELKIKESNEIGDSTINETLEMILKTSLDIKNTILSPKKG